ncbi:phage terminase small subunit [Bacillus cereus]|uniref:phage terminase small subunit n=1 Tax=Bacillus cereus group sp. Bce037 TaxID=3445232 RepID=UPI002DB6D084|nr:phage terminase small subunit [Bacillus cereus]
MARQRSPDRDKAFELWKDSGGEMKLKDIAAELGISDSQIRKWKNQDEWEQKINSNVTNDKSNATKSGAPFGNKNAVGNSGNKNPKWGNKNAIGHGPPKGNDNATTHGLFKKIIPNDDPHAMELLDEIQNHTELDMLFNSIQLQYFNILNSQRIMHVRDKDDMSKEVVSESEAGEAYMVQFAWDKQANLLTAYSRAMTSLSAMIERFDKLANADDERRLKLVQMKTNIEKTQADTDFAQERAAKLKGQKKDTSLLDALIEGRKQYEQNSD